MSKGVFLERASLITICCYHSRGLIEAFIALLSHSIYAIVPGPYIQSRPKRLLGYIHSVSISDKTLKSNKTLPCIILPVVSSIP